MNIAALIGMLIAIVIGVNLISVISGVTETAMNPTSANISNALNQAPSALSTAGIPQETGSPTWVLIALLPLILFLIIAWVIGRNRKFAILGDEET